MMDEGGEEEYATDDDMVDDEVSAMPMVEASGDASALRVDVKDTQPTGTGQTLENPSAVVQADTTREVVADPTVPVPGAAAEGDAASTGQTSAPLSGSAAPLPGAVAPAVEMPSLSAPVHALPPQHDPPIVLQRMSTSAFFAFRQGWFVDRVCSVYMLFVLCKTAACMSMR